MPKDRTLTLDDFPTGTSAWLKTGGPEMLVLSTLKANPTLGTRGGVQLAWFFGKLLQKAVLPAAVLSLSPPEQGGEG